MVFHDYISKKINFRDSAICLSCLCNVMQSSNSDNSLSDMLYSISSQIYRESSIPITISIYAKRTPALLKEENYMLLSVATKKMNKK